MENLNVSISISNLFAGLFLNFDLLWPTNVREERLLTVNLEGNKYAMPDKCKRRKTTKEDFGRIETMISADEWRFRRG